MQLNTLHHVRREENTTVRWMVTKPRKKHIFSAPRYNAVRRYAQVTRLFLKMRISGAADKSGGEEEEREAQLVQKRAA